MCNMRVGTMVPLLEYGFGDKEEFCGRVSYGCKTVAFLSVWTTDDDDTVTWTEPWTDWLVWGQKLGCACPEGAVAPSG
jgi:hypothetical protein